MKTDGLPSVCNEVLFCPTMEFSMPALSHRLALYCCLLVPLAIGCKSETTNPPGTADGGPDPSAPDAGRNADRAAVVSALDSGSNADGATAQGIFDAGRNADGPAVPVSPDSGRNADGNAGSDASADAGSRQIDAVGGQVDTRGQELDAGATFVGRAALLGPVADNQAVITIATAPLAGQSCWAPAAWSDAEGNLLLLCQQTLTKLDSKLKSASRIGSPGALAVLPAPNGDVFIGGTRNTDAVVERYTSAGALVWSKSWASAGSESVDALVAVAGGLYATGTSSGQAPGHPPTSAGGRWIARYAPATGDIAWLKQQAGAASVGFGTVRGFYPVNRGGSIFLHAVGVMAPPNTGNRDRIFDLEGNELPAPARKNFYDLKCDSSYDRFGAPLKASDSSFFTVGRWYQGAGLCVANFALDDSPTWNGWYAMPEVQRKAVIDAVEGVEWTGNFGAGDDIAVTADAIYVIGQYSNTFKNGSAPPPATNSKFVARYTLGGERVWFQQFRPDGPKGFVALPTFGTGGALAVTPSGDVIVVANPSNNATGPYVFTLRSADGTLVN